MKNEPQEIFSTLKEMLMQQVPPLKVRTDASENFEVAGTKEVMQGKQKVDGIFFASLVPKPKDVRFYFFPIYTNPNEFSDVSDDVKKYLKGKSCFHIKKLTPETENELRQMVELGMQVYKREDMI